MATLGQAIDSILSDLGRADTSITVFTSQAIQDAILHYETTRFWFNEGRASFTCSNTIYYPLANLSSQFVEIDQLSATVSGNTYELIPETHQELQRMDVSGFVGQPARWAQFAEQLRLYPKAPSGTTYQVDVMGTKKLATLSASTDTNAWLTHGLEMITARASKMLSAKRYKNMPAAEIYARAEQECFERLLNQTSRLTSTGRISPNW